MLPFIVPGQEIVSTILLIAGNEVRIVDGFHWPVIFHEGLEFKLQIIVKDFSSFHCRSQILRINVPPRNLKLGGIH